MKILLIKLGGSILHEVNDSFFSSLKELHGEGYKLIFVHGGGPDINEMLDILNIVPQFHNGLRKTTKDVLKVVELVLSGKTNRELVSLLEKHGLPAIGLHGNDVKLLEGEHIDKESLGEVGRVTSVNSDLILKILSMDLIPVITPLARSSEGHTLNINADMAAGAVAHALQADSCVFVTNVKGVLDNNTLIEYMSAEEAQRLIKQNIIQGGMIPKVQTALDVLKTGTDEVRIVSGTEPFFEKGRWIGTSFLEKERASI